MTLCFSAALETPLCLPEEDEDGCGDIPTTPKPGCVYVVAMMWHSLSLHSVHSDPQTKTHDEIYKWGFQSSSYLMCITSL